MVYHHRQHEISFFYARSIPYACAQATQFTPAAPVRLYIWEFCVPLSLSLSLCVRLIELNFMKLSFDSNHWNHHHHIHLCSALMSNEIWSLLYEFLCGFEGVPWNEVDD